MISAAPATDVTLFTAWRHGKTEANKLGLLSGGGQDDAEGISQLNETGREQAEKLGKEVAESETLDVIYTSDLSRASDTAKAVQRAFQERGHEVEIRPSMQLREILHGQYEMTDAKVRDAAGLDRMQAAVKVEGDKFHIWRLHPQADEIVPEAVVDVRAYMERRETRPETPYQLFARLTQEFKRIAEENPGKTVGISMHGASIATLVDGLSEQKGKYLPPHYNGEEIVKDGVVQVTSSAKIDNCARVHFKYYHETGMLERVEFHMENKYE